MKPTIKCLICNQDFQQTRKDKLCCSKKCAKKNYRHSNLIKSQCPGCNIEFETEKHEYNKRSKGNKVVYCSHSCSAKNSNKNRAKHKMFICLGCSKQFETLHSDWREKYCSKSCYFMNKGKNFSNEDIDKLAKKSKYEIGLYDSIKANKTFFYRSSWEKKIMIWMDNNDEILTFDYEFDKLPYVYRKRKSNYYPDFLVFFKNGNKFVFEVKPKYLINKRRNIAKFAAGREYCKQNNMEFKILTEIELKALGIL